GSGRAELDAVPDRYVPNGPDGHGHVGSVALLDGDALRAERSASPWRDAGSGRAELDAVPDRYVPNGSRAHEDHAHHPS
ncbi:hypothetical protein, partial [Arsenicicoccus bolidensis]|uniref:hypothetical protein n=1 Tax=Arsenicicoccus bolidensis TaxID=229480 RepID=UPI0028A8950F